MGWYPGDVSGTALSGITLICVLRSLGPLVATSQSRAGDLESLQGRVRVSPETRAQRFAESHVAKCRTFFYSVFYPPSMR